MTITLDEAIARFGVDVDEHLDRAAAIPVLTGLQVQGDVIFIPTRQGAKEGSIVTRDGVTLVRGENGGHTHLLLADGAVMWAATAGTGADVGLVTVGVGAAAYVAHPEHGYLGLGPGAYIARRQVEQADQIRRVAD